MPQLRDSGNHSTAPLDAHTKDEIQSFARIFGIETEYGVSVTGSDRPCDAGQTAMMMFQPIVAEARSTNTYIENGSRLYLDVGSHPEYATAEPGIRWTRWHWMRPAIGDEGSCPGRPTSSALHPGSRLHGPCVQKQCGFRRAFLRLP